MDKPDPLAQLKDIQLPDPIGWWPLAPGWYLALFASLLCIAYLAYRAYRRYHYALAKKHALILLTDYQKRYEQEQNAPLISAQISELLRRVALVYFPREHVASLHGESWLEFLHQTGTGIEMNNIRSLLLDVPFQKNQNIDLTPLFSMAKQWIKQRSIPCSR